MCGIVGYVGHRDALGVVLEALRRLDWKGDYITWAQLEAEGELLPPPLFPSALVTHTTAELTGLTKKTTGEAPAASSVYRQPTRADVSLFVSTNL